MKKTRFNKGSALGITIILLVLVSGLCLSLSLMMYSEIKITTNDIRKKENILKTTNYAYCAYYENLSSNEEFDVTRETDEDIDTITVEYTNNDKVYKTVLTIENQLIIKIKETIEVKEGE